MLASPQVALPRPSTGLSALDLQDREPVTFNTFGITRALRLPKSGHYKLTVKPFSGCILRCTSKDISSPVRSKIECWGWKHGSAVKCTLCFCRGPGLRYDTLFWPPWSLACIDMVHIDSHKHVYAHTLLFQRTWIRFPGPTRLLETVTPAPGDMMPSSKLYGTEYTWYTDIYI